MLFFNPCVYVVNQTNSKNKKSLQENVILFTLVTQGLASYNRYILTCAVISSPISCKVKDIQDIQQENIIYKCYTNQRCCVEVSEMSGKPT